MNLFQQLVSTQQGWATRKVTEYANVAAAMLVQQLSHYGIITDAQATSAFLVSFAIGVLHVIVSKIAAPIAAK
jgi:hypothetical protein